MCQVRVNISKKQTNFKIFYIPTLKHTINTKSQNIIIEFRSIIYYISMN